MGRYENWQRFFFLINLKEDNGLMKKQNRLNIYFLLLLIVSLGMFFLYRFFSPALPDKESAAAQQKQNVTPFSNPIVSQNFKEVPQVDNITYGFLKQASKDYENNRFQPAIDNAQKVIKKSPNIDQAYWLIGMSCYKQKKMSEGFDALIKAKEICKNHERLPGIYVGISLCCMGLGRSADALMYIDKAIEANNGKSSIGFSWVKASCLTKGMGKTREALGEMEKAIVMDPMLPANKGYFLTTYGSILYCNKMYEEAARIAEAAISYDSTVDQAYIVAMESNIYLGNTKTAKEYARKFLDKKFPTRVYDEYCYKATAYSIVGEYKKAIVSLNKAMELQKKYKADYCFEYLMDRAILYVMDGNIKNAVRDLNYFIDSASRTDQFKEEIKLSRLLLEKLNKGQKLTFVELFTYFQ
jgi:tetratricopeptide (TPR) repeat protein